MLLDILYIKGDINSLKKEKELFFFVLLVLKMKKSIIPTITPSGRKVTGEEIKKERREKTAVNSGHLVR